MVGLGRVELPTSPLSGVRSNQLSYRPVLAAPPAGFEPHSQEPGGSQEILIHYKRVSRTWLNVLGGYAAHDHRAMADRAKKACIGAPAPAVRDGSWGVDDDSHPPLRSGPLSRKGCKCHQDRKSTRLNSSHLGIS